MFWFVVSGIFVLVVSGIFCFWKYKKTRNKKYLYAGIVFCILSGIGLVVCYFFMRETYISVDGVMCYEVMPVNVSGIVINKYLREKFVRKYKGILPKDVYDKVTKKD